jgi:AraC-like DNA-binding protein
MNAPITIRVQTKEKRELTRRPGLPTGFYKELAFGHAYWYELPTGSITVQEIRGVDYAVYQINIVHSEAVECLVEADEGIVLLMVPIETNEDVLVTAKEQFVLLMKMYVFIYLPAGCYPLQVSGPESYYLFIQPPLSFLDGLKEEVPGMHELRQFFLLQRKQCMALPAMPVLDHHLHFIKKVGQPSTKKKIMDLQVRAFILEVLADYVQTARQKPQSGLIYLSLKQRALLVKSYLLEHLEDAELYDLGEIAKRFFTEPRAITRAFQRITGKTILQFVLEKRIELAYKYLLETTMPIYEIALRCGFKDASYFIHIFKNKYGMTPGAMRKKA